MLRWAYLTRVSYADTGSHGKERKSEDEGDGASKEKSEKASTGRI